MGRRGPLPDPNKPARRDLAPVVTLNPTPLAPPDPPKGLLVATRRQWQAYFGSEVARALTEVDVPVVERLFVYRDLWARAYRSGDQAAMVRLEKPILALEGQLAATPASRARLGLQLGAAKKMTLDVLRRQLGGTA
jgi:hypothetical protein